MKHQIMFLTGAEAGYSDIQVGPDVESQGSGTEENRMGFLTTYLGKF